jgi:hypothetical protein
VLAGTVLAAGPLGAQSIAAVPSDALDASRAAWRYRRAVETPPEAPQPMAALALPPELRGRAQADLRDLRLVDAEGRDVPYVVDRQAEREAAPEWSGRLADVRREARQLSQWQVDLGEARAFEQVALDVPERGFAKRVRVEASDDGRAWRLLRDDAGIFEREWERDWNGPLRHTLIDLDAPARARFLRLTLDDRRSTTVAVTGVRVRGLRRLAETRWSREAPLVAASGAPPGRSRYRLDLPPGWPLEALEIDAADATFSRRARLVEASERDGGREERVLGEARLFRVRDGDPALGVVEALRLDVQRPGRGELRLEIDDGDSPPLRALRARVSGTSERLLFPAAARPVALYYGNERTRAPLYDLDALRGRLGFAPAFAGARLGDEAPNPLHSPAPPLAFVPSTGAALDPSRWRCVRGVNVGPAEDIYSLVLAAGDLGCLRDDLGDLRLADAQGRQVPYVLEPAAAETRLALAFEAEPARAGRRGEPRAPGASRYRLSAPAEGGLAGAATPPRALPFSALELDVREVFFTRPARLLGDAGGGRREDVLWSGTLARAAEAPRAPLVIPLDGRRRAALALEIDEGDNAALTLSGARAVVRVPRVTFKAPAGEYRLLLGNDEARAPRYDLDALRREVLAWSAVPASAGALADNPAFRRRAADYFRSAPPTFVMWATLAAAVVALLLLTVRVLRRAGD